MADVKISQLPSYPSVTSASSDVLEIVDTTNTLNKKIAVNTLSYGGNKVTLVAGTNVTITPSDANQTLTISATGGGGGGDFSSILAVWTTANAASKNAYSTQPTVNDDGISITLTASANPGVLANATISLNGSALTNTYPVTGSFPSYSIVIPVADLTGNAIETASTVTVAIVIGTQYSLQANNLTNVQPSAFSTTLRGNYASSSLPFYTTTATLNYQYTNTVGTITAFNGTLSPGGSASAASGSFPNIVVTGSTISGQATGTGLNGAGSSTVNLSGSVPAVPTFIPAFYAQTADLNPPSFSTASSQTPSGAAGSTVTYPAATVATQYNWIATTLPLARIQFVSPLGNSPLVPDVTAPTQGIGGQTFNVFGFTSLVVGTQAQLFITVS